MGNDFYEQLARDYDRMIRWHSRLEAEEPWWRALLTDYSVHTILDAACGSGHHLVLFDRLGYQVAGADGSPAMVALAREVLAEAAVDVPVEVCAWHQLAASRLPISDAVICVGNSLPYVTDTNQLHGALRGMWSRVAAGGILVIQLKNYPLLRAAQQRFLPLTWSKADGRQQVCLRLYDYHPDQLVFNVVMLDEEPDGWHLRHHHTPLAEWTAEDIVPPLQQLGGSCELFGGLDRQPMDPDSSPDLVIIARRKN